MKEVVELGATPVNEPCAQVGSEGYAEVALKECRAYRAQLRRVYLAAHGELPEGLTLFIKTTRHDFGEPKEVAAKFEEADRKALNAAFWLQDNLPYNWDTEAKIQLRE